jgi:hypothetical protein
MTILTADTITDDEIRKLLADLKQENACSELVTRSIVDCKVALRLRHVESEAGKAARTRCAELLNARRDRAGELREPPASGPPIKSGADLDWSSAERAAKDIMKQCFDAAFAPPEAVDLHLMRVQRVCVAIDAIVDALRLRKA